MTVRWFAGRGPSTAVIIVEGRGRCDAYGPTVAVAPVLRRLQFAKSSGSYSLARLPDVLIRRVPRIGSHRLLTVRG